MNRHVYEFEISARRKINSSKYPDVKPWVPKAIAKEDQKPRTQLWKGEPSEDDQSPERLRIVRLFRKYESEYPSLKLIADRLNQCRLENRCCSGACLECRRFLQRWFVRKSKSLIDSVIDKRDQRLVAISIIPARPIVRPGELTRFSLFDLQQRLKFALKKIGLEAVIGGIDISFNEDRDGKYPQFWCIHIYVIASVENKGRVKRLLKKIYKPDARIPRPVKMSEFNNSARRRSYAFKTEFIRRIGYDEIKPSGRACRNTSRDKLRAKERLELFRYLAECGLASRLIFRGAKPVVSSHRVSIHGCKTSYQRKSKKR